MFLFEFSIKKIILSLLTLSLFSANYLNAINSKEDAFAALGLPHNATVEQITKAYRALARKYHPDANNGTTNPLMATINAARDFLLKELPGNFDENCSQYWYNNYRDMQKEFVNFYGHYTNLNEKYANVYIKYCQELKNKRTYFMWAEEVLIKIGVPVFVYSIRDIYNKYHDPENKDKTWREIFPLRSYVPLACGTLSIIGGILCGRQVSFIEQEIKDILKPA